MSNPDERGVWVVMGADSALGWAVVREAVGRGLTVLACGADQTKLSELDASGVVSLTVSSIDPHSVRLLVDVASDRFGAIHGIIHVDNVAASDGQSRIAESILRRVRLLDEHIGSQARHCLVAQTRRPSLWASDSHASTGRDRTTRHIVVVRVPHNGDTLGWAELIVSGALERVSRRAHVWMTARHYLGKRG